MRRSTGASVPLGGCVSRSRRTAASRARIARYVVFGAVGSYCARAIAPWSVSTTAASPRRASAKLRINLLEIAPIDEDLARLAARAGRDEALGLHHVDKPSGTAESNAHLPLEIRDRRLAAG